MRARNLLLFTTALTFGALPAAEAKKKKEAPVAETGAESASTVKKTRQTKSQPFAKVSLGATVGGGYDSNVFNKPSGDTTRAGLGEVSLNFKADAPLSTKLSWTSALGLGGSYRSGDGDLGASAAKVSGKAKTGLQLLVFGNRKMPGGKKVSTKKQKLPSGRIALDLKYSLSANPVITSPDEDVVDSEEDLADEETFEEDSDEEDSFEEEDGDEADDSDESEEDEAEDEAEEADEEEFIEDDVLEGKTFDLKGARHKFDGALRFLVEPARGTSLGLQGGAQIGKPPAPEDLNKPLGDYTQFGGGLKASQKIAGKYLRAKAGYSFNLRNFAEKTTRDGEPLAFTLHGISAGLESKPLKPLKLSLTYRFAQRVVGADEDLDSRRHAWSFGTQLKLTKQVALVGKLSFADQGLANTDTKDARRFQGLLGLRVKI
jgi:hypothetical protein